MIYPLNHGLNGRACIQRGKEASMKKRVIRLCLVLFLICSGTWGCSGGVDPAVGERKEEVRPNATAKVIREHAQAPINRARTAANLGDDRVEAMDRAVQNAN
jgi:hypothetical protein